ncbi:probable cytochrome P450 6a13 isoform X2 [Periplaneta americana]|uniref:probable cytochrome P450 6a13 isoform X2 n=1 Tax=Periplaneta americana TaxID=6978 RepID=UPI0037E73664
MALFLISWILGTFIIIIISSVTGLYFYLLLNYSYWKKRGIYSLTPKFPFGNLGETMTLKKPMGETYADIYKNAYGQRFVGIFHLHIPTLVIRDPELIKMLLIKDFSSFHDRGINFVEEVDPLTANLFMLSGIKWENLRRKLVPVFTSGKMKMMFQSIVDCGHQLREYLEETASCGDVFDVKDVMAKYTTDVIASCAFGIRCNCLENPDAEFRKWGKKIFEPTTESSIRNFIIFCLPSIAKFFKLAMVPHDVTKFFQTAVWETVKYREENNIQCNDFLQLMIQLKNSGICEAFENEKPTENTETKGGFETSSTTMTFCFYELALNTDIQNRLRDEIDNATKKHDGNITYDDIQEMTYLDKVVSETLRKYPPFPLLNRECTKKFHIPDSDVVIEKGTKIVIPILGIHRDPEHYAAPDKFDPERFSTEEKMKRHHYAYLPFGEGPRVCIGQRFGLMQAKVGIALILANYELEICEKTPNPLVFDPKLFFPTALNGMWLKIKKRNIT